MIVVVTCRQPALILGSEDLLQTGILRLLSQVSLPWLQMPDMRLQVPPALQQQSSHCVCGHGQTVSLYVHLLSYCKYFIVNFNINALVYKIAWIMLRKLFIIDCIVPHAHITHIFSYRPM